MKKLLMLGAILVLGATAMAENVTEKASTDVKLQAEVVAKNLEITGLDGKDILLDFGTINKKNESDKSRIARAEYKVTYIGEATMTDTKLNVILGDKTPSLKHTTNSTANPLVANLTMEDNYGTVWNEEGKGLKGSDISLDDVKGKGEVYRGRIIGQLSNIDGNTMEGFYEGNTYINVTLNGTKGE